MDATGRSLFGPVATEIVHMGKVISIELDGKESKMSVSGLTLGIIALAVTAALALGSVLVTIDLMPLLVGAVVVIVCIFVGLLLSALSLFRHKRRGMGIRMPVSALAANVIALGAVVVVAVVLVGEYREPTYEEAAQELTEEGLTVHTIGGDRPALLVLPPGTIRRLRCPSFSACTATPATICFRTPTLDCLHWSTRITSP